MTTLSNETSQAVRKRSWGAGEIKRHIAYLTMLLPGFIFLVVFAYTPLPAIIMAFKNYKLMMPPKDQWIQNPFVYSLINSDWSGLKNFQFIFRSPDAAVFLRNTIGYNLLFMALGIVFAIGVAVGINELRQRFMAKLYHTILFLPYFLSWIIITYVLYAFIAERGIVNKVMDALNMSHVSVYTMPNAWVFILPLANIWRYAGNNSIIYLATITGFDQELYEAAAIDGAGKWKQFRHITWPLLVPTIILLQILAVGRILNGDFDMFYSLPNGAGAVRNTTLTIDVYVYTALRTGQPLGLPSAAAFFQSCIGFLLVITTNTIVRKVEPDMAMF
ncbi:MAG: ABC transporter permease subunit [Christensenellaceae bacterium]|jgi:putative aldouronate transport system permease protein|nr:ABC transporter permease subunit [Christensenellaceae bacterium]